MDTSIQELLYYKWNFYQEKKSKKADKCREKSFRKNFLPFERENYFKNCPPFSDSVRENAGKENRLNTAFAKYAKIDSNIGIELLCILKTTCNCFYDIVD